MKRLGRFSAAATAIVVAAFSTVAADPPPKHQGPNAHVLILVPAGRYRLGAGDARTNPAHTVTLKAFAIAETETTNAQFAAFVKATGYQTSAEKDDGGMVFHEGMKDWEWEKDSTANWRKPFGEKGPSADELPSHPVTQISGMDALAYCQWLGGRLPALDEWEAAARAGAATKYPWGDDFDPKHANIWNGVTHRSDTKLDGFLYTAPVKSFPPNAWGLYDVVGNVFEYCSGFPPHVSAEQFGRLISGRGGSWWCSAGTCSFFNLLDIGSMDKQGSLANQGFRIAFDIEKAAALPAVAQGSAGVPLQLNATVDLNGRTATLTKLDTLPFVESDYSKRFKFDGFENPKLRELRERYKLSELIARGEDEFDRQVLLMDWTHRQFKKFGRPSTNAKGALEILKAIDDGHSFFCAQYAEVLVSSAASLGWVDRPLALRRHQGVNKSGGSTEHSVTEIWSNQHRKWIMLDPTSNMFLEKDGMPLNAWEIRQEWFYHGGEGLVFVIGKERRKYKKSNLPIILGHFDGFGDLSVEPDELDKYGFTGYIPNTDLMDAGYDYGKMFIVKDQLCDGTQWHTRTVPANPATDPYFPIGQAALSLTAADGKLNVTLQTLTPNFKHFEVQIDGGGWKASAETFEWNVHPGPNRLRVRTLNAFGVTGPVSTAEVEVKESN